ncbi:uncharacterized protein [Lepeophtheirus salmonis]|uniref:uncharacterized protein n=1 Tax=Lepeophtheirus salmonis TaxID=72036 RepID=UPI001AE14FB2|nr:uncharacterized protein LOC121114415 [Lepeophtheirus salmonis]
MRVRLESLNLRSSDREEKPRTVSRPKGLSSVSSNSLSLLPLAREVANSSGKFNSNQCLSNGLRSTMGRAFRFNEDGFQKARNHPVMVEPQIKIAIEGDRMLSTEKGENFSGNFDNIERKNKSNVLNGKVLNQGKPRKVTSYQEDFGIKKLSTSNMRERISQPNGNGNEFECLASSREHYPTHSYDSNKTMQPVQKDKLTISKPTIQMSSLTTYRKNTDRPLNFMSLKPALRFNQQYRIPDQIDWI